MAYKNFKRTLRNISFLYIAMASLHGTWHQAMSDYAKNMLKRNMSPSLRTEWVRYYRENERYNNYLHFLNIFSPSCLRRAPETPKEAKEGEVFA